jgi:hypothetical protein
MFINGWAREGRTSTEPFPAAPIPFAGAFWLSAIIVRSRAFVSPCSSEEPGEPTKITFRQLIETPAVNDGLKRIGVAVNEENMDRLAGLVAKKRAASEQRPEGDVRRGRGSMDARPRSPSLFRACYQHRC